MPARKCLAVALVALAIACGEDDAGPVAPPSESGTTGWVWQNPLPHGNNGVGIETFGAGHAIAVSSLDVFRTLDGGENWQPVDIGDADRGLYKRNEYLYRRGDRIVVLAADRVYRSEDRGATWRRSAALNLSGARACAFADASHGVVVGTSGSVVTTDDGGASWTPRFSGTTMGLYSVEFLDAQTVLATGNGGVILRSTNGGTTWSPLAGTGATAPIERIDITGGVVRAVDARGAVLTSADGGDTWAEVLISGGGLWAIDFVDAIHGIVAGVDGRIHVTSNGGLTWSRKAPSVADQINYVSYGPDGDVWAVGGEGRTYRSTDAGDTWSDLYSGPRTNLYDVSFAGPDDGMAVGPADGMCGLLVTHDGGRHWARGTVGSAGAGCDAGDLNGVWVIDASRAVVVGKGGHLWTTSDGGTSWTRRDSKTTLDLFGVAFADDADGIAVGEFGQIRITDDGGASWTAPVGGAGTAADLTSVAMGGAGVVMIAGYNGTVRRSEDGGATWTPAEDGIADALLHDIAVVDQDVAVALGGNGFSAWVFRTTDGGISWSQTELAGSANRGSVAFVSKTRGYVLLDEGVMHMTGDGGRTWQVQRRVSGWGLWGACAVGDGAAVVVGGHGTILRTTTGGR